MLILSFLGSVCGLAISMTPITIGITVLTMLSLFFLVSLAVYTGMKLHSQEQHILINQALQNVKDVDGMDDLFNHPDIQDKVDECCGKCCSEKPEAPDLEKIKESDDKPTDEK